MKALFATATAAALASALLAAPSTALAGDDRRGWGRHGGWDHPRHGYQGYHGGPPHWHKHHHKHHYRHYYGPPPHVYYGPPPRVVYRAPVYAPPPPVVVYPRPYPPVGQVSIGFGFHF